MLYAKVVLDLAAEGPFDYIIPSEYHDKIKPGLRAWVNFCARKRLGYIVGLSHKTRIKKLKTISTLIDENPVLSPAMLVLSRKLADYYCCSWGEAISAMLPVKIRNGSAVSWSEAQRHQEAVTVSDGKLFLFRQPSGPGRRQFYFQQIEEARKKGLSALLIYADHQALVKADKDLTDYFGSAPVLLGRQERGELSGWLRVRSGLAQIAIGTRSAVFAPFSNLGLIIIDEEDDQSYKQEQTPHYHVREVALLRRDIEGVRIILASSALSLEALQYAGYGAPNGPAPDKTEQLRQVIDSSLAIEIIAAASGLYFNSRKLSYLSRYSEEMISSAVNSGGKVLVFFNRKGFATLALCNNCAAALKCPRCNINLVYHFRDAVLSCHYCNYKMPLPQVCPQCNAGYIRYTGIGTEKLESELARLFPQARITRLEDAKAIDSTCADIFISTQALVKAEARQFDLLLVLGIDRSLNRVDFRAAEKTFSLLVKILRLAKTKAIIETRLPSHHVFRSLMNKDIDIFYDEELRQRRELRFPPYRHFAALRLRAPQEAKVKKAAEDIFILLNKGKARGIEVISLSAGPQPKLRGNFYWQVLCASADARRLSAFLKKGLKDFPHSGIIVTVDMDPL